MTPEDRELLHRHLSGDLRGAELEAFFGRLKDSPELRRALASFAADEALLSEAVLEHRHQLPRRRSVWRALAPSAAAAAILLAGLVFLLQTPSAPAAATLLSAASETVLLRGGKPLVPRPGLPIREGDEIRGTVELRTSAGIMRTEPTAVVTLRDRGEHLVLDHGRVRGALPGLVSTPAGAVRASPGSSVEVAFAKDRMRVIVEHGSARVEHSGATSNVSAGRYLQVGTTWEEGRVLPRAKLDESIGRAQAFLAGRKTDLARSIRDGKRHAEAPPRTYAELGVLALPDGDPVAAELVEAMLGKRIESTYTAALQAVALTRLDAVKHRDRILQCYRFLAESQCLNGQWDYGEAQPQRRPSGDNSCSAYAALGLRACQEAGIEVDREVVRRARAWWLQSQNPDGGWGYHEFGRLALEADPPGHTASNASYGSTTASGVSSILVLSGLLGEDYRGHVSVRRGLEWLAANHAVDRNPRKSPGFSQIHYWLALERVGLGLGTEHVGPHEWYADGAEFLLARQQPDGAWRVEQGEFMGREIGDVLDTCLAVLFLRRVPFSREEQW